MEPYLGEIRLFGGNFAPVGWNFCDGTVLSISSNDALFSLIGTTYGGDGVNTFALPDLRGRVPVHQGQGQGLSPYTIGQNGGVEQVMLTAANLAQHTHALVASTSGGTGGNASTPANNVIAQADASVQVFAQHAADQLYNQGHVSAAGSGGNLPHENRQAYVAINYIIALAGIYPSAS